MLGQIVVIGLLLCLGVRYRVQVMEYGVVFIDGKWCYCFMKRVWYCYCFFMVFNEGVFLKC